MTSRAELERQVAARAADRCEYCRMHQSLQGARFHLEHIVPIARGGATDLANLAWACPGCNLCKSDRVEGTDPDTGSTVRLYHPRTDTWNDHFIWDDYQLVGKTTVGRATIVAFDLNHAQNSHPASGANVRIVPTGKLNMECYAIPTVLG